MAGDDLAFLARSPNRGAVLGVLVDDTVTRGQLRRRVAASRVTIGRITDDLEARGWAERDGNEYRATSAGRAVYEAYEQFVGTVETTHRLATVIEQLPVERFDFDLTRLADAEVVTPMATEPDRHLSRLATLWESAASVRMAAHAVAPQVVASSYGAAMDGTQETSGIVTPAVVDALRADQSVRGQVCEMLEGGTFELAIRETVPFQFGVFDETTIISADDEAGVPRGIVITDEPSVREWALETFEPLRDDATPLPADALRMGG